ncbi:hypothetical protein PGT21_010533 [Puccinia graminis f. sp. tritici]|uniref:Phosphoribosylglycinamide synthetase N-terminal domain-containing protein n=1 Tax=Puccinia graminis f. sp. tritici TaxID=56615 RepID=A0A5B0M840_PUCGR|nr:hypothetical protein PGT21_000734 [Puccinia graminis f. sp. tritici]KAA1090679.1 hypothetical protein PGT21_010533 [Puccinia graminis f. sp. tritici]
MKVLVIGSGGREHALAERLAKSDNVTKIYLAPGNGGSQENPKCANLEEYESYDELINFAQDEETILRMAEVDRFSSSGTGTRFNQWNRRSLSQDWGTMFRPK